MQHRLIGLVRDGAQHFALGSARVGEQSERLVAVAGEEHGVETHRFLPARLHEHAARKSPNLFHRSREVDAVAERRRELLDVARRAAVDGAPRRPVVDGEHAVVVQESHEESCREFHHRRRVGGPDRRPHRHDVVVHERAPVAAAREELAERKLTAGLVEQARRLAVESQDVAHHAEERRSQQVAPLREQRVERRAVVLEPGDLVAHREAHAACLRRDAELVEQRDEVRVGAVVEDDEAGVHVPGPAVHLDCVRVRVAADVVARLEHRDVVLTVEFAGRDVARDAGTDDRNLHGCLRRPRRPASRIDGGTGRRSRTMPSAASSFRPYQLRSSSHQ